MLRIQRGFTLIEMMVVLSISLIMLMLVAPVFKVVSTTTINVERKLDVYEAARSILDGYEQQVQRAFQNERGELFGLKNTTFTAGPTGDKSCIDGTNPDGSKRYFWNVRACDAVFFPTLGFVALNANTGGYAAWARYPKDIPFALLPNVTNSFSDLDYTYLQHSLIYRIPATREIHLRDVNNLYAYLYGDPRKPSGELYFVNKKMLEAPDFLSPWKANEAPWNFYTYDADGWVWKDEYGPGTYVYGFSNAIRLLDLDIAYWDDVNKLWRDPPDDSAVYFAPMPKAIRMTICVTDYKKRLKLVLCRVMQLPCGSGNGELLTQAKDLKYCDTGVSVYNRPKDLNVLDPWARNRP